MVETMSIWSNVRDWLLAPSNRRHTFTLWWILTSISENVDLVDSSIRLKEFSQLLIRPWPRDLAHKHFDGIQIWLVWVIQGSIHFFSTRRTSVLDIYTGNTSFKMSLPSPRITKRWSDLESQAPGASIEHWATHNELHTISEYVFSISKNTTLILLPPIYATASVHIGSRN